MRWLTKPITSNLLLTLEGLATILRFARSWPPRSRFIAYAGRHSVMQERSFAPSFGRTLKVQGVPSARPVLLDDELT